MRFVNSSPHRDPPDSEGKDKEVVDAPEAIGAPVVLNVSSVLSEVGSEALIPSPVHQKNDLQKSDPPGGRARKRKEVVKAEHAPAPDGDPGLSIEVVANRSGTVASSIQNSHDTKTKNQEIPKKELESMTLSEDEGSLIGGMVSIPSPKKNAPSLIVQHP